MASTRFPYPIPFGWFAVGRIDELSEEPVSRLHYFDQELVLWRENGSYHLAHAACPHLGAHLAVGGEIVDDCLVCPFHGWAFDRDGHNASIPYADRPNRKARLRTFPVEEHNGLLLAWYHPDPSVEPTFEVPDRIGPDDVEAARLTWRVRSAWQEVAENSVDMAHFKFVHGMKRIAEPGKLTLDGPYRSVESTQVFSTARGDFEGNLLSNSFGPGIGVIYFDLMGRVTLVSATTPVDLDEVDVRFTFYHSGDPVAVKIAEPFAAEVRRQFEQDMPIWEAKFYNPSPALAPSEKGITTFRKWAAQFYAVTPS